MDTRRASPSVEAARLLSSVPCSCGASGRFRDESPMPASLARQIKTSVVHSRSSMANRIRGKFPSEAAWNFGPLLCFFPLGRLLDSVSRPDARHGADGGGRHRSRRLARVRCLHHLPRRTSGHLGLQPGVLRRHGPPLLRGPKLVRRICVPLRSGDGGREADRCLEQRLAARAAVREDGWRNVSQHGWQATPFPKRGALRVQPDMIQIWPDFGQNWPTRGGGAVVILERVSNKVGCGVLVQRWHCAGTSIVLFLSGACVGLLL